MKANQNPNIEQYLNESIKVYGLNLYYTDEIYAPAEDTDLLVSYLGEWCTAKVKSNPESWYGEVVDGVTHIWANFSGSNPNTSLTEINVRESAFFPEISGLKYITVDGLQIMHTAENWQPPNPGATTGTNLQMGAIGTRMGKHWIIQNCTIINARCVGICLGLAPGVGDSIDDFA